MMFLAAPSAIPLKPMEIYALVNIQKDQKAIEAMAEIVDLPNLNLVIFHSYVSLPEGKMLFRDSVVPTY